MLKEVTPELSCPVVLFSYFNPIVRRGLADFAAAAKDAGVDGLIVPDLPWPYAATSALRSEAKKNKLELVGPFASHLTFYSFLFFLLAITMLRLRPRKLLLSDLNNGCMHMQVLLTTPATPEERMKEITRASEGFIYHVSACRARIKPQIVS